MRVFRMCGGALRRGLAVLLSLAMVLSLMIRMIALSRTAHQPQPTRASLKVPPTVAKDGQNLRGVVVREQTEGTTDGLGKLDSDLDKIARSGRGCSGSEKETALIHIGPDYDYYPANFISCSETRIILVDPLTAWANRLNGFFTKFNQDYRHLERDPEAKRAFEQKHGIDYGTLIDAMYESISCEHITTHFPQLRFDCASKFLEKDLMIVGEVILKSLKFYGREPSTLIRTYKTYLDLSKLHSHLHATKSRSFEWFLEHGGTSLTGASDFRMEVEFSPIPRVDIRFETQGRRRWLTLFAQRAEDVNFEKALNGLPVSTIITAGCAIAHVRVLFDGFRQNLDSKLSIHAAERIRWFPDERDQRDPLDELNDELSSSNPTVRFERLHPKGEPVQFGAGVDFFVLEKVAKIFAGLGADISGVSGVSRYSYLEIAPREPNK